MIAIMLVATVPSAVAEADLGSEKIDDRVVVIHPNVVTKRLRPAGNQYRQRQKLEEAVARDLQLSLTHEQVATLLLSQRKSYHNPDGTLPASHSIHDWSVSETGYELERKLKEYLDNDSSWKPEDEALRVDGHALCNCKQCLHHRYKDAEPDYVFDVTDESIKMSALAPVSLLLDPSFTTALIVGIIGLVGATHSYAYRGNEGYYNERSIAKNASVAQGWLLSDLYDFMVSTKAKDDVELNSYGPDCLYGVKVPLFFVVGPNVEHEAIYWPPRIGDVVEKNRQYQDDEGVWHFDKIPEEDWEYHTDGWDGRLTKESKKWLLNWWRDNRVTDDLAEIFPATATGFRQAGSAIGKRLRDHQSTSIQAIYGVYSSKERTIGSWDDRYSEDKEFASFRITDEGRWTLTTEWENDNSNDCGIPNVEVEALGDMARLGQREMADRIAGLEVWTPRSAIMATELEMMNSRPIEKSVTRAEYDELVKAHEQKEEVNESVAMIAPLGLLSALLDPTFTTLAVIGITALVGMGSYGKLPGKDEASVYIDRRSETEDDVELHLVSSIYYAYGRTFKVFSESVKGVRPDAFQYMSTHNAVTLREAFQENVSDRAKLLMNVLRIQHQTDLPPWRLEPASVMKVIRAMPKYGREARIETNGGRTTNTPDNVRQDGLLEYKPFGSDDPMGFTEGDIDELVAFFNEAGRGRGEGWLNISWGRIDDEVLDKWYSEDDIQRDLETLARADENYRNVIDLPGILTTADAQYDRAMIGQGVEEAKARLTAVGRLPTVEKASMVAPMGLLGVLLDPTLATAMIAGVCMLAGAVIPKHSSAGYTGASGATKSPVFQMGIAHGMDLLRELVGPVYEVRKHCEENPRIFAYHASKTLRMVDAVAEMPQDTVGVGIRSPSVLVNVVARLDRIDGEQRTDVGDNAKLRDTTLHTTYNSAEINVVVGGGVEEAGVLKLSISGSDTRSYRREALITNYDVHYIPCDMPKKLDSDCIIDHIEDELGFDLSDRMLDQFDHGSDWVVKDDGLVRMPNIERVFASQYDGYPIHKLSKKLDDRGDAKKPSDRYRQSIAIREVRHRILEAYSPYVDGMLEIIGDVDYQLHADDPADVMNKLAGDIVRKTDDLSRYESKHRRNEQLKVISDLYEEEAITPLTKHKKDSLIWELVKATQQLFINTVETWTGRESGSVANLAEIIDEQGQHPETVWVATAKVLLNGEFASDAFTPEQGHEDTQDYLKDTAIYWGMGGSYALHKYEALMKLTEPIVDPAYTVDDLGLPTIEEVFNIVSAFKKAGVPLTGGSPGGIDEVVRKALVKECLFVGRYRYMGDVSPMFRNSTRRGTTNASKVKAFMKLFGFTFEDYAPKEYGCSKDGEKWQELAKIVEPMADKLRGLNKQLAEMAVAQLDEKYQPFFQCRQIYVGWDLSRLFALMDTFRYKHNTAGLCELEMFSNVDTTSTSHKGFNTNDTKRALKEMRENLLTYPEMKVQLEADVCELAGMTLKNATDAKRANEIRHTGRRWSLSSVLQDNGFATGHFSAMAPLAFIGGLPSSLEIVAVAGLLSFQAVGSWVTRNLKATQPPATMDMTESFDTVGGYIGHDDGSDLKLSAYVPTTNRQGFCHSPEQGRILNWLEAKFRGWAVTGEPARLNVNSVAGSGKTSLVEVIAKMWTNMGLGAEKVILTCFNTHIAEPLKMLGMSLKKDGLTGFKSMGYSNTASAGGRELVHNWIQGRGDNPVMAENKYRNLSRIALSNAIDTAKLMELRLITGSHEEVKSEVKGWFTASRGVERGTTACRSAGIMSIDGSDSTPEIIEILRGQHGQHDDVQFAKELLGEEGLAEAVQWVLTTAMAQLVDGEPVDVLPTAFVPDKATGYYSQRMMKPASEVLGRDPATYEILGLRFPLGEPKPEPKDERTMHTLGSVAPVDTRGGVPGRKKVLAEWVDDGSVCLRTGSWHAGNEPMGLKRELEDRFNTSFDYPMKDGNISLRSMIVTLADGNQAPTPENQYRYLIQPERALDAVNFLIEKLGEGPGGIAVATDTLDSGSSHRGNGRDIHVSLDDYVYACVYFQLRAVTPASLLIVDEVQDFSELQGRFIECFTDEHTNLIAVGDVNQSLYLFNFASSDATAKLVERFDCTVMPMTICWRNSTSVVSDVHDFMEKNAKLAEIEGWNPTSYSSSSEYGADYAHHSCPDSDWREGQSAVTIPAHLLPHAVELGDLVTCRVNAPLAKLALRTLIDGGKNITLPTGGGLQKDVLNMVSGYRKARGAHDGFGLTRGEDAVTTLTSDTVERRFNDYYATQLESAERRCGGDLQSAKNEQRFCDLMDKAEATMELLLGYLAGEYQKPMAGFEPWLNSLCGKTEGVDGHDNTVRFASVHRTKGAQGNVAFVVVDRPTEDGTTRTFMLPHAMKNSAEVVQELNGCYVAVTRAIDRVVYVSFANDLAERFPTWDDFRYVWEGPVEGETVIATQTITENGFIEEGVVHVHAERGDLGKVIHVEDGFGCVRFAKTGTATDVGPLDVNKVPPSVLEALDDSEVPSE